MQGALASIGLSTGLRRRRRRMKRKRRVQLRTRIVEPAERRVRHRRLPESEVALAHRLDAHQRQALNLVKDPPSLLRRTAKVQEAVVELAEVLQEELHKVRLDLLQSLHRPRGSDALQFQQGLQNEGGRDLL